MILALSSQFLAFGFTSVFSFFIDLLPLIMLVTEIENYPA